MLFEYETDRMILKVLRPDQAHHVLSFYNRNRALFEQYETDRCHDFYTVFHQQRVLRCEYNCAVKQEHVRYYAARKDDPKHIIGTVCLHNIMRDNYLSAEIGYKFSAEVHGQGYASEAVSCIIDAAFHSLELNRLTAMVCHGNEPSIRLLEKLGFQKEGTCREYLNLHGTFMDHHLYSLLASDI